MSNGSVLFGSLDACLGPADNRFFGSGYKRVEQRLRDIRIDRSTAPGSTVTASASMAYPADWSRKSSGRVLRPHLSSIDALVLAASLAEAHLVVARSLAEPQRRRVWVRRVDMRAGARPHETLTDFPVHARLLGCRAEPVGDDRSAPEPARCRPPIGAARLTSEFACRIGGIRVRCQLVHEPGQPAADAGPAGFASIDDVLGPAATRHYGGGYKCSVLHVERVAVDLAGQRVHADQRIDFDPGHRAVTGGAEAAYAPSVSLVDAIVSVAQLAQALLYTLDGMDRADSDTLWLRRMTVRAGRPDRPVDRVFPLTARMTSNRTLVLRDQPWRVVDLEIDDFAGIDGLAAVAHRLPGRLAA